MRLTLALAILLFASSAQAEACGQFLSTSQEWTQNYLAYLSQLRDEQILAVSDLAEIEKAPLANPLSDPNTTARRLHARELAVYLQSGQLISEQIKEWAHKELAQLGQMQTDRFDAAGSTASLFLGKMHTVKGGIFRRVRREAREIRNAEYKGEVTANAWVADFQMMAEPLTHEIWEEVMGVSVMPDYWTKDMPVSKISSASAMVFANRASELLGLTPYYHFDLTNARGVAEEGDFEVLGKITEDETSNGFRLPKAIEYDYIVSVRGAKRSGRYPQITKQNLGTYAYTRFNSGKVPHTSRARKPIVFDGMEFWDLLANLQEWTGNNSFYGSHYNLEEEYVFTHGTISFDVSARIRGFRLARTLK